MSELQPYRSGAVTLGRTGRALVRLSQEVSFGTALSEARAEIEAAKIDAISAVATRAMQDVALLSQVEQSLAQAVPHASGRLATIADFTAIAVADSVAMAARRIGRQ